MAVVMVGWDTCSSLAALVKFLSLATDSKYCSFRISIGSFFLLVQEKGVLQADGGLGLAGLGIPGSGRESEGSGVTVPDFWGSVNILSAAPCLLGAVTGIVTVKGYLNSYRRSSG